MTRQPLDALPIWAVYILTVLIAVLMAEVGYQLGSWWHKRSEKDKTNKEGVVGALVGATLAMLAFLIVFVNSFAADRFDNRRQLVLEEANAIGTTYLRAGFLDEPYRAQARQLLPEYVESRLAGTDPGKFAEERAHSEQIQNQLWADAEAAAGGNPSAITALYVESLNEVIDAHEKRITAAAARVPVTIWIVIYFVAFLSMLMVGFNNGLLGSRSLFALVVLVLIFSAVILLIVDLDRPQEGFLQVSQQPMIDVQNQLRAAVR
jgi:hypothetical protein